MGNIYRDTTLNNVSEQDIGKELKVAGVSGPTWEAYWSIWMQAGLKISVTTAEYLSLI